MLRFLHAEILLSREKQRQKVRRGSTDAHIERKIAKLDLMKRMRADEEEENRRK